MSRVGVYSGTFDPIHEGHIGLAEEAMCHVGLDRVVFLPEREPRGKQGVSGFEIRVDAMRTSLMSYAMFDVLELDETQFTIAETLPLLQRQFAGDELVFVMGSDVARYLSAWPEASRLGEVVVGLRNGDTEAMVAAGLGELAGVRYSIVESPFAAVSSSKIRNAKGRGIKWHA